MSSVIIRSTKERELDQVVQEVMEACRWSEIVKPDANVVVKPNLVSLIPERIKGANTNMELLEAVIRILQTRTRNILVGESDMLNAPHSCPAEQAFELNGLDQLSRSMGFELINFSRSATRPVNSELLQGFEMPVSILDADVLISMPVLKTHKQAYFTGAIKNLWGCVPRYDRLLLHRHLHECLAEVASILKPRLAIMDAIVAMDGHGPTFGNLRPLELVLASTDVVALDATAMRMVSLDVEKARYIEMAHKLGVGEVDESRIQVDGDLESNRTIFEPAPYGLVIRLIDYVSPYRWFTHGVMLNPSIFGTLSKTSRMLRRLGILHH